jgi:prepilin-type N-terminal cleavage/methylation domain-containing protein
MPLFTEKQEKELIMKRNCKGFTLVEIMIVVAIIGILAAIAIPNFIKARRESQRNSCLANMKQIEGAIEQYLLSVKNGRPADVATLCAADKTGYLKYEPHCPQDTAQSYQIPAEGERVACPKNPTDHDLTKAGQKLE